MDGEWSDGAASGGEQKASGDGVSADCNSPGSPSPPAVPSTSGRRRSLQKRVVTVPLADLNVPRPKGVGEGNTPTDSWAWRKYGQKPIKGSPFPRAYYRCSSSKGCPARKQVERSQADPDTVLITYSYEHNHSSTAARVQSRPTPKPGKLERPLPSPEPAKSDDTDTHHGTANVAGGLVTESPAAPAIEVHDDFRWLYDVVSVTSSTSPSQVEAADDMLLYGPMFFGKAAVDTAALLPDEFGGEAVCREGSEEDDAMFAGLGELPECAIVFRRHAGDGLSAMAGGVKVEQPAEGTAMT
ncbi:putative WRKY transcription factor 65 [Hordeum vulgare]|uniref:WRKY domain-containing protein n=2 Tax=Hordeum vulgare subsp. vulgare TaxID=112509 RepID=A0A8I6XNX2_HORVV|nr:probable WRKY transcription factor 65 [Hordeum vulgare subsp. vulgare]KAE8800192.1 putative WRKY transcription factor 65 [Hordeum vulgare]KAI5000230.1 hypothetical protein ZWY2020_004819 [Hordeum vulgare]